MSLFFSIEIFSNLWIHLDLEPLLPGGAASTSSPSTSAGPSVRKEEDPAWIREMLAANPDQLALLRQNNPRLAEAYQSGSLDEFAKAQSRPLID
jgi:DNA damage-inducible protein 1